MGRPNADGLKLTRVITNSNRIEDKRTPSLREEVLGADTTGPAVASRCSSNKLGMFCSLPKRDLQVFRRLERTVLLLV